MTYSVSSNASVGVQTTTHESAEEALAAALDLGATAHLTVTIADGNGRLLTMAELEKHVLAADHGPLRP